VQSVSELLRWFEKWMESMPSWLTRDIDIYEMTECNLKVHDNSVNQSLFSSVRDLEALIPVLISVANRAKVK